MWEELKIIEELDFGIKIVVGPNGIQRPYLFEGLVFYSPHHQYWFKVEKILGDRVLLKEETGTSNHYTLYGAERDLYSEKHTLLVSEDGCPDTPDKLLEDVNKGDPIISFDGYWDVRSFCVNSPHAKSYRLMKIGNLILPAEFEDPKAGWNCKCGKCGADAYMGLNLIECSRGC